MYKTTDREGTSVYRVKQLHAEMKTDDEIAAIMHVTPATVQHMRQTLHVAKNRICIAKGCKARFSNPIDMVNRNNGYCPSHRESYECSSYAVWRSVVGTGRQLLILNKREPKRFRTLMRTIEREDPATYERIKWVLRYTGKRSKRAAKS